MTEAAFDWLKPSPTWDFASGDYRRTSFFQPALAELKTDDFVEEWLTIAASPDPAGLRQALLEPPENGTVKLYQPIHGRYYMVTASLCCRIPGFPDRAVATADDESVFFVLRRRVDGEEYAWTGEGAGQTWQSTGANPRRLMPDEERFPMTPAPTGNGRSVLFGYLPVSSNKTYPVPASELAEAGESPPDLRVEDLAARFTEPITGPESDPASASIQQVRDDLARTVSVYILLGGWEFFLEHLPDVAAVIRGDAGASLTEPKLAEKQDLVDFLTATPIMGWFSLRDALEAVAQNADVLNQEGGVEGDGALDDLGFHAGFDLKYHPLAMQAMLDLLDLVRAALPGEAPSLALPKLSQRTDAEYVVRTVYERAQCEPVQHVVGLPSQVFRLAPFYDPDAPARPFRISLPADVSIAGLRKFKKNVSFMMSESMQRKMDSLRGKERDLIAEETELTEGGGIAFICSFSIQIIFIVAFMLLIMFVFILNIVFWWIAFFRICLPIPKSLAPK